MSATAKPTSARMASRGAGPNERDFARILEDEDGRFVWEVYAGNGYPTHRSRGSYSRRASAERALEREHPGVVVRED